MKTYQTKDIRNVALISHGGAGKTSLTEALLFTSEAVNRLGRVDNGTTTSDFDPDEIKRQMSLSATLAPVEWKNTKINLLDTPGYFDFVGEVQAALRVADSCIVVVCAASGVEVGTEKVWGLANDYKLPRLVVMNKMERENANFNQTLEQLREFFGLGVIPVQAPIGQESSFKGVVDLINMKALIFNEEGKKVTEEEIPEDLMDQVESYREMMMETVAEADDELLLKYLDGEPLSQKEIQEGLKKGVMESKVIPVVCGSYTSNIGSQPLLDLINSCLPSPAEVGEVKGFVPGSEEEEITRKVSAEEPLSALVYKTLADPYVGRINFFKVYSGKMQSDSQVYNSNKDKMERFGQVFLMRGKTQINISEAVAGDIAAVAKLSETTTGDTLCNKANPIVFSPITFPKPVISYAVKAKAKGEEEKVFAGLTRFLDEDPTLEVEKKTDTKQTLLWGIGELQLDIVCNRLSKKFGVEVDLSTPKIPYKETIRTSVKVEGKHKKQSGGRGQFGHVWIELEPSEEEFEFVDKIFGGSVPRQYIPAVEKGIREAMEEGILAKNPVVNVRTTLYDGSYHTVDSSEMAFKIAASMAFKKAFEKANPVLLEPIMEVEITVPDAFMGDIMGDMNSKRGRILGTEPLEGGQMIRAHVPLSEMFRYSIDLRSMTQGRGSFSMHFNRYEEVPDHIAQKVIEAAQEEQE
ncbi:elongation factor G [Candidatus Contubernalis alkaliaceticus]|uniref:elongation factor G n=1 Tax=Candidatus Contubernalis alkaliaceticus TaxID=338645 RepID=UPI001F4BD2E7|nr:elongation factor G [Candidatus Contubernalis alkalaceticus]UNC90629.1 elongation factor G [Candidatus Contubernalis alkalaceticus]